MELVVKPLSPRFGAEVSGVDISRPLDEDTKRQIRAIQDEWGVTVWRDTGLTDATHVAFSRLFGHVELAPTHGKEPRFSEPELFDASNIDRNGEIVSDEGRRLINKGNRLWHIDSSYMDVRSAQALLLCHEAPDFPAPTWFADARSAYDDLPPALKDRIEGLTARHCYFWSRRQAGYPYTEEEIDGMPHAEHPLVHVHQGSGRKTIYLGAHARDIVGMERAEGRELIKQINDWVTQEKYVISVDYRAGDMTIWDNLCVFHRAGDFDDLSCRRDMRRTTIREPGVAAKDDHFTTMFAKAGRSGYQAGDLQKQQ